MTKPMKKLNNLLPFPRLFTRSEGEAYESIPFQSSESFGDESAPILSAPEAWSNEAVSLVAVAACKSIPADLRSIEENTVPSWLWRHQSRGARRVAEGDLRDIIDRVTGSAAAKAWKLGMFTSEKHARAFTDEIRYALMQRQIAIDPAIIAPWGLSWAYGIEESRGTDAVALKDGKQIALSNAVIDSALGKKDNAFWKRLFATRGKERQTFSLNLSDITADWNSTPLTPARAAIDLMALRHNDGSMNIDALRQAARMLTILLDLHQRADVTVSLANLHPLLLALGLAYDSEAARAMSASLAALVTAECYATSAELACLRGASEEFFANRDSVMRSLRNHHRAVYGDKNDYEKLSVLPSALSLKNCPDLALVAEAQRRWDDALAMARAFGLRATQVTDMTPSPKLAMMMGSATQGLEPLQNLTVLRQDNSYIYRAVLNPVAGEALARLDYPRAVAGAASDYITGARNLRKSPAINNTALRAKGLTNAEIEKIEAYLPNVNTIRLAVTPWIIGVDFCIGQLKIPARKVEALSFDLLAHLGFSDEDVSAADLHCYGHGTLRSAKILELRHRPLFACGAEISSEARLRMAAAVQSFVSGNTGIALALPLDSVEKCTEITLAAWRSGVKSLSITVDPDIAANPVRKAESTLRRITAAAQSHAKPMPSQPRQSRSGKQVSMLGGKKPTAGKQITR